MNIASLCQREVVSIDAESTLRQAAILMAEQHVGSLVVVTGSEPPQVVGIVTDRDLAIDGLGRHANASDLKVGQLAKSSPLGVEGSASVAEAVAAMEKGGVRRLLVLDPGGGVIGLVAADDLLGAVSEELGGLARALRANIRNEEAQRQVVPAPASARPVFPSFGTAGFR